MRRAPAPLPSFFPLPRRQLGWLLLPFSTATILIAGYIDRAVRSELAAKRLSDAPFKRGSLDWITEWPLAEAATVLWALLFLVLFAPSGLRKRRTDQNL